MNYKNITGIYVHIPFCVRKCDYCSFFSLQSDPGLRRAYTKRLCEEITVRSEESYAEDLNLKTLYFGGGTPSLLETGRLREIVETLHSRFDLKLTEQTIEMNPDSVTMEKLIVYKDLGFNRVSLGVQSLEDRLLKRIGRVHDSAQALRALELVAEAGFDNVSVDLMYALPGQKTRDLESTLNKLYKNFSPPHLSAYALILEEGTPLYERMDPVSDELEAEMSDLIVDFLKAEGLSRYEISNYARGGYESRHNSLYWNMDSYFGFGAGASSFLSGRRIRNTENLQSYLNGVTAVETVKEDDVLLKEEMIFTGLRRMTGIDDRDYRALFGSSIYTDYSEVIEKLQDRGLLATAGERIFLTERGLDLSNRVFIEFIQ